MIASGEWLTPTRATGIAAYGVAMICCAIAWAKGRRLRTVSQLAALLTAIESALVLDMIFNWRWMLHQELMDLAQRWNEYDLRRSPQRIAIVVLTVLLLLGVIFALRVLRGRTGRSSCGFRSIAFACLVVYRSCLPSCCGPRLIPPLGSMDAGKPGVGFRRPGDLRGDSHRCSSG